MRASASDDRRYLLKAVRLGEKSRGMTRPNPPVGAVIVRGGRIVGEGRHVRCGANHAETAALESAGANARGATVYVSLEPCSKPGRVGACTDALIKAGVARVVWACEDPNPVNRGQAARVLEAAGIVADFMPLAQAEALIRPFAKHVLTGLPYVTVKLAMSLDGRIADDFGDARWISSADSRRRTGRLREQVDVVLVGAETVRRDDPSLLCHTRANDNLYRAVISRSGRLPRTAQVLNDAAAERTLVYRDIDEAMKDLGKRGFLHVLCEGGLKLATSLAEAGYVDEWLTVLAPLVIAHRPIGRALRLSGPDCFFKTFKTKENPHT